MKPLKHGIELRFSKGRKLRLLSYAVWVNGYRHVDHVTTAHDRVTYGADLQRMVDIERHRNPSLEIL